MHRFQKTSDDDEEKQELKKLDKGLALSPKQLGITLYNPDGTPQLNLVQQQDDGDSWIPHGQPGLAQQVKQAHAKEDEARRKADGLKGDDLLGSIGLSSGQKQSSYDNDELELLQDGDWVPSGQSGLAADLKSAHQKEAAAQLKSDGLAGDDMLGSAGMGSQSQTTADADADDLELMQDWSPQGQHLNDTPEEAAERDAAQDQETTSTKKKQVEQMDILGAVHLRHHLKDEQEDEVTAMGVINTDDIQLIQAPSPAPTPMVSKKSAKKAVKVTKKVGFRSSSSSRRGRGHISSKQMVKNIMFLKVYATLTADKVVENSRHLGALGSLLKGMAVKSKKSAVAQYRSVMVALAKHSKHGLPKYTLRHVAKAMAGKGLIVMAPVQFKAGIYVRIDGKDLGLQNGYPLLGKLAVRVNAFVQAMASLKKKTSIDLKSKQHFSLRDFNRLFRPTCMGKASAFRKCERKSKSKCATAKDCKWISAWDGSEFSQVIPTIAVDQD